VPGIEEVCLATNGVLLADLAPALYMTGLHHLNQPGYPAPSTLPVIYHPHQFPSLPHRLFRINPHPERDRVIYLMGDQHHFSFHTLRLSSIFFRTMAQVGLVRKDSR
jgi:hypothetical protein